MPTSEKYGRARTGEGRGGRTQPLAQGSRTSTSHPVSTTSTTPRDRGPSSSARSPPRRLNVDEPMHLQLARVRAAAEDLQGPKPPVFFWPARTVRRGEAVDDAGHRQLHPGGVSQPSRSVRRQALPPRRGGFLHSERRAITHSLDTLRGGAQEMGSNLNCPASLPDRDAQDEGGPRGQVVMGEAHREEGRGEVWLSPAELSGGRPPLI